MGLLKKFQGCRFIYTEVYENHKSPMSQCCGPSKLVNDCKGAVHSFAQVLRYSHVHPQWKALSQKKKTHLSNGIHTLVSIWNHRNKRKGKSLR
jgi:hypothetical protein